MASYKHIINKPFLFIIICLIAVFLIASCCYYKKTVQEDGHSISFVDFRVYYYAAMGVESNQNIYDTTEPEFIYKYSPIFALAVSTIKFLTVTPADGLRIWYLVLFICLALSLYIIKEILSGERLSLTLDVLRIIPLLFIFRYLILVNFIMYLPTEWPTFVKIFDRCLYVVGAGYMLSLIFSPAVAREKKIFASLAASLFLNLRFIVLNIDRAQANLIILLLVLFFIYYLLKGKDVCAGIYLGIGIVFKLAPAIFLLYLALKKRWKAFHSSIATFVFFLVLPSVKWGPLRNKELILGWIDSLRITFREEYLNYKNQSLFSMLSRFFSKGSNVAIIGLGERYIIVIIIAAYIMVLSLLIYVVMSKKHRHFGPDATLQDLCLFMTAMTFLSPVGTMHTFVYMILPIALLVKYAIERGLKDKLLNAGIVVYGSAAYLNSTDIIGNFSIILNKYSVMTFILLLIFTLIIYTKVPNNKLTGQS